MNNFPKKVILTEVGPRDGFQLEAKMIPTEMKLRMIRGLAGAGVRHIQVTAFVNPGKVPQMADAVEVARESLKIEGLNVSALALNARGVIRAGEAGITNIEISISASETHNRKNTGMSLAEARAHAREMVRLARGRNMKIRAGIQCAFGCGYEGAVPLDRVMEMAADYLDQGVDMLCLADTTGMAAPPAVNAILARIRPEAGRVPVALHFHDTRGLGLVNLYAALAAGVAHFDASFAGLGGCPFVRAAAGNIATEDALHLLASMGIDAGADIRKISACSLEMAAFLGRTLPGKVHRLVG